MPHFRAQMNCVPGMVTKFAFTPTVTTEMRKNPSMIDKVININNIREDKSKDLNLKVKNPWILMNSIIYFYVIKYVVNHIIICK